MDALIVLGANIKYCPYFNIYLKELLHFSYSIDVVYWDRYGLNETIEMDCNVYPYKVLIDDCISPIKKIPLFVGFRKHVLKIMNHKSYDLVIVLDTQFAVLISDKLLKKYRNKYLFDMRDLSYEFIPAYKKIMNRIVDNSLASFISSDGYRQFFNNQSKLYTLHNYKEKDIYYSPKKIFAHDKITISFWGILRDLEVYKEMIHDLSNDDRFMVRFYGPIVGEMLELKNFVDDQKIYNIAFSGSYSEADRYAFAATSDILFNVFLNPKRMDNPIMSNKYYDGVFFGIPQIVMKNSFMEKCVKEKKLGIVHSEDASVAEEILMYIESFKDSDFHNNCAIEKQRIVDEQNKTISKLREVLQYRIV